MDVKSLSLIEIKNNYLDRHGFVFQGASDCDSRKCILVAEAVRSKGFTDYLPELVAQLDTRTFVFIYPECAMFESGAFYEAVKHLVTMFGAFQIEILNAFLKEN